jgi:hypothetical protein
VLIFLCSQADGFHLEILAKLRDVKTVDTTDHLLGVLVQTCFASLPLPLKDGVKESPLPAAGLFASAAEVNFDELAAMLVRARADVTECATRSQAIVSSALLEQQVRLIERKKKKKEKRKRKEKRRKEK